MAGFLLIDVTKSAISKCGGRFGGDKDLDALHVKVSAGNTETYSK